jgi:hypothetical protein
VRESISKSIQPEEVCKATERNASNSARGMSSILNINAISIAWITFVELPVVEYINIINNAKKQTMDTPVKRIRNAWSNPYRKFSASIQSGISR